MSKQEAQLKYLGDKFFPHITPSLASRVGGSLNPQFVEWLMGYPINHTALKASATRLSRKSRKSSSVK